MESSAVQRVHGTYVKAIVYGNYAEKLPRVLPNNHSHKWRMFIRPFFDEDISRYVSYLLVSCCFQCMEFMDSLGKEGSVPTS